VHGTALWLLVLLLLVAGVPLVLLAAAWLGQSGGGLGGAAPAWGYRHELAVSGDGPFRAVRVTIATRRLRPPLILIPATLAMATFATATPVMAVLVGFVALHLRCGCCCCSGPSAAGVIIELILVTWGLVTCAVSLRAAYVVVREPRVGVVLLGRWLRYPALHLGLVIFVLLLERVLPTTDWSTGLRLLGWTYALIGGLAVIGWVVARDAVQRRMAALRDPRRPAWSTRERQEPAAA
jgi:hypothetical protein